MDAGCGPGPLTIPLAKAVEPTGEVVALDTFAARVGLYLLPIVEGRRSVEQDQVLRRRG